MLGGCRWGPRTGSLLARERAGHTLIPAAAEILYAPKPQVHFATLGPHLALTHSDFLVLL
jgi:hypothetical protein